MADEAPAAPAATLRNYDVIRAFWMKDDTDANGTVMEGARVEPGKTVQLDPAVAADLIAAGVLKRSND